MGLAQENGRGRLAFAPDWQDRLKAMELHLDIAKRLAQARALERAQRMLALAKGKGLGLER